MNPAGTSRQQAAAATPAQGAPGTTSGTAASSAARAYANRRVVPDLSSLPLQILLHLNVYYIVFYWICELLMYIYKGVILPYPDLGGTLAIEIVLLFVISFIEGWRLYFGYKGNLAERKEALVWCIILALPMLLSQLYMILWQTYVLRVEVILCAVLFIMVVLEVVLSAATIWTFQRHAAFIHR